MGYDVPKPGIRIQGSGVGKQVKDVSSAGKGQM